jgi:hypothetical protein
MEENKRTCSVTGEKMTKGFVINDGEIYIQSEANARKWALDNDFISLADAYENGCIYYTEWNDEEEPKEMVVHCKKSEYDIYIGRPSKWGNPFTHRKDKTAAKYIVKNRQEAIDSYREWITEGEGKHLLKQLGELKGKVLGCWCKPNHCHGDVLIDLVSKIK